MSSKQTQAAKLLKGPILKSVGKQKKNLALDVALVQSLLNKVKLKPFRGFIAISHQMAKFCLIERPGRRCLKFQALS